MYLVMFLSDRNSDDHNAPSAPRLSSWKGPLEAVQFEYKDSNPSSSFLDLLLLGQQHEQGQCHKHAEGLTTDNEDDEWELLRFALLLSLVPALPRPRTLLLHMRLR